MKLQKLKVALLSRELMRPAVCISLHITAVHIQGKAGRENNLLFLQSVAQILSRLGL